VQIGMKQISMVQSGCVLAFGVVWTLISLLIFFAAWSFRAPWFSLLFTGIFVLFGLGMVGTGLWKLLVRPALVGRYLGPASASVSSQQVRVGERVTVRYEQPVRADVELGQLTMKLVLREWAQYRRGSSNHTVIHDNVLNAYDSPGRRYARGETLMAEHTFSIPTDGMHSFNSIRNKLIWMVKVQIALPASPDAVEEIPFVVVSEVAGEARRGSPL
jgi:hypothetical protein